MLVGKNTVMHDNPTLTARDWSGQHPVRVVLDSNLEVPPTMKVFNKDAPTLIFNVIKEEKRDNLEWVKVDMNNPLSVLGRLYRKGILSVIIEGGTQVLNSFVQENCWDEARVFSSKKRFGKGVEAPEIEGQVHDSKTIEKDHLTIYRNQHG